MGGHQCWWDWLHASYREARLMEELVRYQPDLFIIYGSHNELLEQRLYGRVERQSWAVGALTGICPRVAPRDPAQEYRRLCFPFPRGRCLSDTGSSG